MTCDLLGILQYMSKAKGGLQRTNQRGTSTDYDTFLRGLGTCYRWLAKYGDLGHLGCSGHYLKFWILFIQSVLRIKVSVYILAMYLFLPFNAVDDKGFHPILWEYNISEGTRYYLG